MSNADNGDCDDDASDYLGVHYNYSYYSMIRDAYCDRPNKSFANDDYDNDNRHAMTNDRNSCYPHDKNVCNDDENCENFRDLNNSHDRNVEVNVTLVHLYIIER
jgi:hypothetical protein